MYAVAHDYVPYCRRVVTSGSYNGSISWGCWPKITSHSDALCTAQNVYDFRTDLDESYCFGGCRLLSLGCILLVGTSLPVTSLFTLGYCRSQTALWSLTCRRFFHSNEPRGKKSTLPTVSLHKTLVLRRLIEISKQPIISEIKELIFNCKTSNNNEEKAGNEEYLSYAQI